jgi:hypothetical protein
MEWFAQKQEDLGVAGEAEDDFSGVMAPEVDKSRNGLILWLEVLYKGKRKWKFGTQPCFFSAPEKSDFLSPITSIKGRESGNSGRSPVFLAHPKKAISYHLSPL